MNMTINQEIEATASSRKLATIRKIAEIKPHPNADLLELAIVDGWQCVVKKGEFQPGQTIVYFEIDSWIPDTIAPFLSKGKKPREYEGVSGEKLRTIRLRGELSQGLVMPLSILPDYFTENQESFGVADFELIGMDVTDILGIKKWEKPVPAQMRGFTRGNFPSFIRKTDQERIQNLFNKLTDAQRNDIYEVTLKVDGSSATFYVKDGEVGVCSRNLELKTDESNADNMYVKMFNQLGLREKLMAYHAEFGKNIAIQGEIYGAGINGNWEGISDVRFMLFDVFDIDKQRYIPSEVRYSIANLLGLQHVPVIGNFTLADETLESLLALADRPSLYNKVAEGIVFKSLTNPDFSFKVINNEFLLNGGN